MEWMRPINWTLAFARSAAVVLISLTGACSGPGEELPSVPVPTLAQGAPDYATYSQHFLALQDAGLKADYNAFAGHLDPADLATVVRRLDVSFGGQPFDVFTQKTDNSATTHRRLIELRGQRGRLYLAVRLERVSGGWKFAGYTIGRDRHTVMAQL